MLEAELTNGRPSSSNSRLSSALEDRAAMSTLTVEVVATPADVRDVRPTRGSARRPGLVGALVARVGSPS